MVWPMGQETEGGSESPVNGNYRSRDLAKERQREDARDLGGVQFFHLKVSHRLTSC